MRDTASDRAGPVARPQLGQAIRMYRRRAGLTLTQLSERSGLSVPFLSQLENNRANPSLHSLQQIASALDLASSDIVGAADARLVVTVTHRPEKAHGPDRTLVAQAGVQVREITRQSGDRYDPVAHTYDCMIYVVRGMIELTVDIPDGRCVHELGEGDSVVIAAGAVYEWQPASSAAAVIEVRHDAT